MRIPFFLRSTMFVGMAIIVGSILDGCTGQTSGGLKPTAPTITTSPANQTVMMGQPATFSVAATGTPPLSYQWQFNGSDRLARFINANEATILTETHEVPLSFEDAPFQGGAIFNNIDFWSAPAIVNPEARHKFSLNTCNGCHGGETNTAFLHIFPRIPGQPSTLSATLEQMIYHTSMVRRGTQHALVVCDMPFLTYQVSTEEAIRAKLYTASWSDPDLLIRTSGEQRLSNFLLWQLAYAELYITPVLWPDFNRRTLLDAILEYQRRDRRFGKVTAS